ncbi:hypothetical protein [Longitalea arenae]|uniref:hypothetical protein n=1 Tax=Longitalea arenae TaxID=2812558 RepID=UPI001966D64F|nr:hypothetical protein [Longitalea arenae]
MTKKAGLQILTASLFVIGAVVGLYFQFSYHKFLNNDTLSYINIAERYAEGDWQHAINGFWSPMYCWILCVCTLAGLPLLQSCYVINFFVAGIGLYILCKLASRYITHLLFYGIFSLYALLLMLFYAMSALTPDLMAAVFCCWFLLLVTDAQFVFDKRMPLLAGLAAACAYFSKLYNFVPVNIFMGISVLLTFINKRSAPAKERWPLLKAYAVFLLLSCSWIAVLSIHEGKPVVTTAGRFNHNFMSPDWGKSYPTDVNLYAPPYEKAYSAHTNPAHLLDEYGWSPLADGRSFSHQVNLIRKSLVTLINYLDSTGAKWFVFGISLLVLYINRKKLTIKYNKSIYKIALFFICYPLLYLPLFVLDRYVLVCIILFHLFLFFIVQLAWQFLHKKIFMPVMAVLLAVSIIPFAIMGQRKLARSSGEYQYYKSFYQHLPQLAFLRHQSIASDGYSTESTQLCYYLKCRYYGSWTDNRYESLKQFPIRYLVSKKDYAAFPFLILKEKLLLQNTSLYIYEIR